MSVKKITGANTREALRMLRELLGSDAVILSNRSVNNHVEILAIAGVDMEALVDLGNEHNFTQSPNHHRYSEPPVTSIALPPHQLSELMDEMRSMRGSMESQLSELVMDSSHKRDPSRALVMREMLAAGFSASLSRYLSENQPERKPLDPEPVDKLSWLKNALVRNIFTMENDEDLMVKGGVFALVGPTGVGKTTTTAKLAARCVMRHGPSKLALITTDGYRVGAYEQLRIYGKILGVMVHSVKDEADLRIALAELKSKHTILIDTVGMSQRDKMVPEQVAMLMGAGQNVQRFLCLSATSSGETLNEVITSYASGGLTGCILTKLDEAATIGGVLDVLIRHKLRLNYVANGQRVPEDICLTSSIAIVEQAFKLKNLTQAFHLRDSELSLVAGPGAKALADSWSGVNLG
jgi:flagellar biosynthesis protein FlhF